MNDLKQIMQFLSISRMILWGLARLPLKLKLGFSSFSINANNLEFTTNALTHSQLSISASETVL